MKNVNLDPTRELYEYLDAVAQAFNEDLFEGRLSKPLFTLRRGSGTLAHFSARSWRAARGKGVGEIALNPDLFAQHSWLALLQAIAQAQCDLWQHAFGEPSRPGYRNTQWARKMKAIGLIPSHTGLPGGREIGQGVTAYPAPRGKFIEACAVLAAGGLGVPLSKRWLEGQSSRSPVPEGLELGISPAVLELLQAPVGPCTNDDELIDQAQLRELKRKLKYTCPRCDANVWGRPGLNLQCASCGVGLRAVFKRQRAQT